jgi:AP-4 complex subunit epsilon-1
MQMMEKLRDAKAMLQSAAREGLRSGMNTEFEALVRSIGECKSKQEEDRIMAGEIELLKARFSAPGLDKSRAREYMVRAIYVEMLGHDVSWAQVKAMQFASESNIQSKKVTGG